MNPFFPVDAALPEIVSAWKKSGCAVISAAPGAGKTTRIPAALLPQAQGKIYLIEPRRLAAAAAASRLAELAAEKCGQTFGYQVRGESCMSKTTQVLAVTPGVLLRKLQHSPELPGVETLIFDEFHERSCEVDLALALALEVREALRPELKILIMSATLNAAAPAQLLGDAPIIQVPGREFPVEQLWSDHSCDLFHPAPEVAQAVRKMYFAYPGDMLVFLPGVGEILQTQELLAGALDDAALLFPLHGGLSLKEQQRALNATPPGRRKIVLATNVAESSLTIDGITLVVDSGLERRGVFDPNSGLTRLETGRISRASAQQRTGRAGRTAPGVAFRLWSLGDDRGRLPYAPPEILDCDLSSLALELAVWGATPDQLKWLDPPPAARLAVGQELLRQLGALDKTGHLTAHGQALAELPVHPRIGNLLQRAAHSSELALAIDIAALLEENSRRPNSSVDLRDQVENFQRRPEQFRRSRQVRDQLRHLLKCPDTTKNLAACGKLLSFAYPERVARSRGRHSGCFLCANGKAAALPPDDNLAAEEFLAIGAAGGHSNRADAQIQLAAPLSAAEVEELFNEQIAETITVEFNPETTHAQGFKIRHLGAIELHRKPCPAPPELITSAVLQAALKLHRELPPRSNPNAQKMLNRLRFAAQVEPEIFGEWTLDHWEQQLTEVIVPLLGTVRSFAELERAPWADALHHALSYNDAQILDARYPAAFRSPAGAQHLIDYQTPDGVPQLAVKLQEMLGVTRHPTVGSRQLPLRIELLSPAGRPIQITSDLPSFWQGSYSLVRKEMRARYPKHFWPENPAQAAPQLRTIKTKVH